MAPKKSLLIDAVYAAAAIYLSLPATEQRAIYGGFLRGVAHLSRTAAERFGRLAITAEDEYREVMHP